MFCPQCGAEYRSGFTRCPDCDVDLSDDPPDPPASTLGDWWSHSDLVCVYASPNPIVAQLVIGVLANEGIEYAAQGGYHGAYPVNVGALSEVTVFVRPEDAARARELVRAAERGDFALDD